MAQEVELEEFRSQWRKELGSQNVSMAHPKKIPKKNMLPDSDKQQVSWSKLDGSKKIEGRAASLLLQVTENVNDVVYQPFVIVGQLLKEGTCPNSNTETDKTDLDRRTLDNTSRPSKRSYFDSALESNDETQGREKKKKKKTANCDEGKRRESFIDYLVADLDEINEIPFFEITLARELALKIFQYLDLKDLCRCAQVSKSWQSLSEDNWLWYNVYYQRGKSKAPLMTEEDSWKSVVKEEHQRQRALLNNWKVRLGRVRSLLYVQAGVLSAASFHKDTVVAGYTNGQVKLHNLDNGDVCVFQPSDMSLQLDNTCEEGTVANDITLVDTTDTLTVAVFKHGFVDIWWNDGDLKPCHTVHCGTNITAISLTETHSDTLVAVTTGPHVIFEAVEKRDRDENGSIRENSTFQRLMKVDFGNKVSTMKFLPNTETSCAFDCRMAVATKHVVKIYAPPPSHRYSSRTVNVDNNITLVADSENSTEVHNMYGTPITSMEVSGGSQPTLAVGLGSSTGLFDGYQVKLYDLSSGKPSVTFHGHTWYISCMHLNSDSNEQPSQSSITLATGCGDRKVRLYDARCSFPVMTLAGHTQKISSVQADKWKIVSGGEDGVVTVWDIRMATRLWDWHNRPSGQVVPLVKLYDLSSGKPSVTFHGHTWYISCMHLNSDSNEQPSQSSITLATGCGDRKVRLYDARCSFPVMTLAGHTQKISSVQADKWKIVSGGEDGVVTVWDIRMATRLWDWHNRHPVRLCRYNDRYLVVANVPDEKFVDPDNDGFADRKHRGSLQVYDFLCDDQHDLVEALPDICRSSYDQLHGYDYGINLVTPYDTI
ncbi:F-box/WD repeat-containing protein 8 [Octopus sinensis]|uniref:F-box/WD repeat-containing protein 8 n=1 Tax=Octopus sinensis TaxID=2607531 RepID=A0A7E6EHB6_9MOLL|nr:F-box/WD repeat-containing protein 8 [Octopus sinensis]